MKAFIAYTLVVIGLPIFIGHILGMVSSFPISFLVGLTRRGRETPAELEESFKESQAWMLSGNVKMDLRDRIAHTCLDIMNGFWATLAAGFLFHLFGLPPGVAILLIVAAWEILFTMRYGQSYRALLGSLVGIFAGWFVVLRLFSAA